MIFNRKSVKEMLKHLNDIWDEALTGEAPERESEAFQLAKSIVNKDDKCDDAKLKLATCYYFGIGCEENTDIVRNLCLQLVDNPECFVAYKMLGFIAFHEKSPMAFKYLSKYLEYNNNDTVMQMRLAECYAFGLGVDIDRDKAISLYEALSQTDYGLSSGFKYEFGCLLEELRLYKAIELFEEALKADDEDYYYSSAALRIGSIYHNADFLPIDKFPRDCRIENAIKYYRMAIELGDGGEESIIAQNGYNILLKEIETGKLKFDYLT